MKILTSSLVAATLLTSLSASSLSDAFKNGSVAGEVRAMYVYDSPDAGAEIEGFAVGGSVGYTTADYNGLTAGATFYTAHTLGEADDSMAGALLVDESGAKPESTSILGQAYIQYVTGNTIVKVGRQQIDTPLAGSDDIRVIPNLFEAALIINKDIPNTTLIAGHVSKMMGLVDGNGDKFEHMSDASPAGGLVMNEGVSAAAAIYSNEGMGLTAQLWDYYAHEILNAVYFDVTYSVDAFSVAGQYYTYSELGKVEDAGLTVGYSVFGLQGAYSNEDLGLGLTLSYNKVSDGDMDVSVFGTWGGYPEFVFADETWFYSFGTDADDAAGYSVALDYDFSKVGVEGLSGTLKYVGFDLTSDDVDIVDILASYSFNDNFSVGATYEMGSSDNKAFERDVFKLSANYSF